MPTPCRPRFTCPECGSGFQSLNGLEVMCWACHFGRCGEAPAFYLMDYSARYLSAELTPKEVKMFSPKEREVYFAWCNAKQLAARSPVS